MNLPDDLLKRIHQNQLNVDRGIIVPSVLPKPRPNKNKNIFRSITYTEGIADKYNLNVLDAADFIERYV